MHGRFDFVIKDMKAVSEKYGSVEAALRIEIKCSDNDKFDLKSLTEEGLDPKYPMYSW